MTLDFSETTAAWLAGFFDGEGCACAKWDEAQPRLPSIIVNITQSDLDILTVIGLMFTPSRIHKIHAPYGKRPCYQISWEGKKAIPFLTFIQPYVKLKKIQVNAALESLRITPSRGKRSSDGLKIRRAELALAIKAANNKKQPTEQVN